MFGFDRFSLTWLPVQGGSNEIWGCVLQLARSLNRGTSLNGWTSSPTMMSTKGTRMKRTQPCGTRSPGRAPFSVSPCRWCRAQEQLGPGRGLAAAAGGHPGEATAEAGHGRCEAALWRQKAAVAQHEAAKPPKPPVLVSIGWHPQKRHPKIGIWVHLQLGEHP